MDSYLEQYEAREGGVTFHTWTDVQGAKKENFYITGMPGTPIPWWFRKILQQKHLTDVADFPCKVNESGDVSEPLRSVKR